MDDFERWQTPPAIKDSQDTLVRFFQKDGAHWGHNGDIDNLNPGQCAVRAIRDLERVAADHKRLVRRLDVLLNGINGAAKQASLCDIVAQIESQAFQSTSATESGK
jgi:hypothetical protein